MKHLARSLYYWLAATSETPSSHVLSCSDSTLQLADSSLQVGQIFIHVGGEDQSPCRDKCGVLFREIVSDLGDGLYTTSPATFAQVFPEETYDAEYAQHSIESILPSCDGEKDSASLVMSRRSLQETTTNETIDRKKYDDDDDDYDDDHYVEKKEGWEAFCDATQKFI